MNSIQFKTNELLMFHSDEPIGRPIGRPIGKPIGEPAWVGQVFLKPCRKLMKILEYLHNFK